MATRLSTAARNAAANAVVDLLDVGTTNPNGLLRIYTGAQPASPNDAATGTLLAEVDLDDPAYGAASGGAAALAGTPLSTVGLANGNAGWGRLLDQDETAVIDGSVTGTGGGGDLELDNVAITIGQTVNITALPYTQPLSE